MKDRFICLVCGAVVDAQRQHVIDNPTHALVEAVMSDDNTESEIVIKTSIEHKTSLWGDICHQIFLAIDSPEQQARLIGAISAAFLAALDNRNWQQARGIAGLALQQGQITMDDYELIDGKIPVEE